MLKGEILNYIERNSPVTFAELKRDFRDDFPGSYVYDFPEKGIILWDHMSERFIQCLKDLIKDGSIEGLISEPMVYLYDGGMPRYPVASSIRVYNETHWLPIVFTSKWRE